MFYHVPLVSSSVLADAVCDEGHYADIGINKKSAHQKNSPTQIKISLLLIIHQVERAALGGNYCS
jgi:hypothetical protein